MLELSVGGASVSCSLVRWGVVKLWRLLGEEVFPTWAASLGEASERKVEPTFFLLLDH